MTKRKLEDDDNSDEVKKEKKRLKKEEKKRLLEQLPKTDEDGIAYTKLQIRRMLKRVKRGLPPIPSKQEAQELKRQEAITRREEEAEFAGLADTINEDDEVEEQARDDEGDDDVNEEEDNHVASDAVAASTSSPSNDPSHKQQKKRSKPVPEDYVCQACQNEEQPAHWIYDCPKKITVRGTNQVSKKLRGVHAPNDQKVFVSGLSFDMKKNHVESLFKDCGTIVHCKLLTFPDTGRCKGQAYVTFDSGESAKKAMRLSGTTIANDDDGDNKKKKKKKKVQDTTKKRKELKLKVTKVLNRTITKQKKAVHS